MVRKMTKKIEYSDVYENIVLMRTIGTPFNEGNVICINQSEGLIFVDSGRIATDTKKFRDDMEKRFNKKALMVILTHTHMDHYLGIEAFKDIPILVSELGFNEFMEAKKQGKFTKEFRTQFIEGIKREAAKGTFQLEDEWHTDFAVNSINANVYLPTLGIPSTAIIGDSENQYIFKIIGGHSEDSAYLYNEKESILIAGDNFNCEHADNSPCMLAGAIRCIDILKQFETMNISKVIPGHGPVVGKEYITTTRTYLENMLTALKKFKSQNLPIEEVMTHPDLPKFFEDKLPKSWNVILTNWYNGIE
ncbi:MAG: MBL fold metallo-hydrolase [Asgard group archaeon]|nr:MBL fold metallo-hydrolase [Asgard group archaeon]